MKMNLLRSARSRRIATEHDFPLLPATEADPMAEEEVLQIQRYLHVPTIQRASLQPFEIEHSANVSLQDCITHHRQAFNFLRYFIDPPKDETYRRMLEKQLEAHDDRYEYLQRIQDRGYRTIPIKIPTRHSMLESVGSTDAAGRRTLTAVRGSIHPSSSMPGLANPQITLTMHMWFIVDRRRIQYFSKSSASSPPWTSLNR